MLKGERQTGRHPQVVQTHGGSMGETLPSVEVAVEVGATSAHPSLPRTERAMPVVDPVAKRFIQNRDFSQPDTTRGYSGHATHDGSRPK